MKSFTKKVCALALGLSITLTTLSGCYFLPDEEEILPPPTVKQSEVTYSTVTAKVKDLAKQIIASGSIASASVDNQSFSAQGGVLKDIYVFPGDVVEEGQLIAELETYDLDEKISTQELYVKRAQLTHQIAVEKEYSQAEIDKAALDIELEKNDLNKLYEQKNDAKLYATSSGTVSAITSKSIGEYVNVGESIATLIDVTDLYITIYPNDLTVFKLDTPVQIRIDGVFYDGYVSLSADMLTSDMVENQKYYAQVKFTDASDIGLMVGNLADVILVLDKREDVVVVSNNLIKKVDGKQVVYVLEDGKKVAREVEIGLQTGSESEIISGISAGEEIVIR